MKFDQKISFSVLLLVIALFTGLFTSVAFAAAQWQRTVDDVDEPTIVGGEEAAPGAWPWMVALVRTGRSAYDGQFCGGSLIHPHYVLTAAHCTYIQDPQTSTLREIEPGEVYVIVNDYKLTDEAGQRINVKRIIRHPNYGGSTEDHDLALFELETAANLATPIDIIGTIPGNLLSEGRMSTVIGWGLTIPGNNSTFPDVLRQVEVPLVPLQACWDSYGMLNGQVTANMLCAGLIEGGKDSCQGDSGGPLMTFDPSAQHWQQIGIVSWGTGCAEPKYYGVYTNLANYAAWIAEQIPALSTPVSTPTATATSSPTTTDTPTATHTPTPIGTQTPPPTVISSLLYLPLVSRQQGVDAPTATPTATQELIFLTNGDFEQGQSGWRASSLSSQTLIRADVLSTTPHSGSWVIRLLGIDNEVAYVAQQVTIPVDTPLLTYWFQVRSDDSCGYDFGGVVLDRSTIVDSIELCKSQQQLTWQQRTVDLSSYAGQTVEIAIRGESDSYASSELLIDDVAFLSTVGH